MTNNQHDSNKLSDNDKNSMRWISPTMAFLLVSLSLGQLGDGLNIFQGIYLVGIGWNEGSVGAALSLMGLTSLIVQPLAGDWVDKATIDRRVFLTMASIVTAMSASSILIVGNDYSSHCLMYTSKIIEGIASSFIGPCLAALTLASFGPDQFDAIMASNILWGHVGSVAAALLAGWVAYAVYPHTRYCFLVIGVSALIAIAFVQYLPQGDPLMGRGFAAQKKNNNTNGEKSQKEEEVDDLSVPHTVSQSSSLLSDNDDTERTNVSESSKLMSEHDVDNNDDIPEAASYMEVFFDPKTRILCFTGFFFHFANANVLLVLGELMGQSKGSDAEGGDISTDAVGPPRTAMPFTAGAIVTAQLTMTLTTYVANVLTERGVGRKPLFMACLLSLPLRCALIIWFSLTNAGSIYLMSTQIFDGIGGGLFGLIHPYLIADITFGTGRFNVIMGLTASFFGMGATLSNFLGQMVVQHYGHEVSLTGSLLLSLIPIVLFHTKMPETYGKRGVSTSNSTDNGNSPVIGRKDKEGYQTFSV